MIYIYIYLVFIPLATFLIRYKWESLGYSYSWQEPGDEDGLRLFVSLLMALVYPIIIPLYSIFVGCEALSKYLGKKIREMQK